MLPSTPDLQPTLRGDRITVRPIKTDDWSEMFSAAADPGIWELHPARDRYNENVFREFFNEALACRSAFAFIDNADGSIVGSSRYYGFDAARGEIEIGWTFLSRKYWSGTINREIKRLMLAHAFTFVDAVVFWVGEENWRSRRAMTKIGGVLRPSVVKRPSVIEKTNFLSSPYWRN